MREKARESDRKKGMRDSEWGDESAQIREREREREREGLSQVFTEGCGWS